MTGDSEAETVSPGPRYAIYFVPPAEGALYRFGAGVIGYDCYSGRELDVTTVGLPDTLTRAPRVYGFHATLKAPFRLAASCRESDLLDAVRVFAAAAGPAPVFAATVALFDEFVAVVPRQREPAVDRLAADCVAAFDRFRAPMTGEERQRRQPGLTQRQSANLDRFGYPYVGHDFRFHMTLTGRIAPDRRTAVLDLLQRRFERNHGDAAIAVNHLAVLRQDHADARFHVQHANLVGGAS